MEFHAQLPFVPLPKQLYIFLRHQRCFQLHSKCVSALLRVSPFHTQKIYLLTDVLHVLNRPYLWELTKLIQYHYIFAYQVLGKHITFLEKQQDETPGSFQAHLQH